LNLNKNNFVILNDGLLTTSSGEEYKFEVRHGNDLKSSLDCDASWGAYKLELFEYITEQNYEEEYLREVLDSIQLEDHHWDWAKKMYYHSSDNYEWLFLYADKKPQGACLIYHPKNSVLETNSKIFYVEYIAVAPWNRNSLVKQRFFSGVGSTLLKSAQNLAVNQLGLTPGFSLRSLPQSSEYYRKIKMIPVPSEDDGPLMYFELPLDEATALAEAL